MRLCSWCVHRADAGPSVPDDRVTPWIGASFAVPRAASFTDAGRAPGQHMGPISPSASLSAPRFFYAPEGLRRATGGPHARVMSKAGRIPPAQVGPDGTAAAASETRADPRRPLPASLRERPDPAILRLARALARQAAREDHARDVHG
jgi:hypothetical protein